MNLNLSGLAVALATPFTLSGEVDLAAFRKLVRHVVAGGVDTLVPLGTTGEASTLLDAERDAVITACLEESSGHAVVVGTGHNATRQTAALTRRAQALDAGQERLVAEGAGGHELGGPGVDRVLHPRPGHLLLHLPVAGLQASPRPAAAGILAEALDLRELDPGDGFQDLPGHVEELVGPAQVAGVVVGDL